MFEDHKQCRCWAEVDLRCIDNNYRSIRENIPHECRFLGVVKANAYGHGAVQVAERLEKLGADYLAVATLDEAIQLRECGIGLPILILGWTSADYTDDLMKFDLTQAIGSSEAYSSFSSKLSESENCLKVHIKIDTGMGRTGFDPACDGDMDCIHSLINNEHFFAEGIFTHFAVADEPDNDFTRIQFKRFAEAIKKLKFQTGYSFELSHCANSGAVINFPTFSMDMVRPGLALYGYYPAAEHGNLDLKPAFSLKARIAMIKEYHAGDTISYGRTFIADHDMRVAVVTIGYADGLSRSLSNNFSMLVNGKFAPQIGRICMDMCMIDVTDIPECSAGDTVTVFGADGCELDVLAEKCGTISYELLCAVSARVPRLYIE